MRRLSIRRKVVFVVMANALVMLSLELAARAIELVRTLRTGPGVESAVYARFHPLRYEFVPGAALPANGAVARINSVGLRGPDPDRPARRIRILCLGDSCTFGYA